MRRQKVALSLVIPIHNEQKNIQVLARQLEKTLKRLKKSFQIIWIDDGSTDSSLKELEELVQTSTTHTIIVFRRNFGQTAAIAAGFELAEGDVVVTLDDDLQNSPKDIPKLLHLLDKGYDLVSGWRLNRKDDETRVFMSQLANFLIGQLSGVKLHDFGCTLKAYRGDLVKELRLYGEMHRFIPAVASQIGARITEVPIAHYPRKHGVSKYGLDRTFRVLLDVILVKFLLTFQNRPLHLFGSLGIVSSLSGGIVFGYLSYEKLFNSESLAERPLFIVSIFMIMLGIQFITIGILAEMLMRVYYESQGKKPYYIRNVIKSK